MSQEVQVRTLYYSRKKDAVKELLNTLDSNELNSLAQTASNKRILPQSRDEAIDTVLLFTVDCERLLSYKRITNQVLGYYLHFNGRPIQGHATRAHLITNVLKFWDEKFPQESGKKLIRGNEGSPLPTYVDVGLGSSTNSYAVTATATPSSSCIVQYTKSNVFAHDFVEWFYGCLNKVRESNSSSSRPHRRTTQSLDPSVFCLNATLDIYLVNPTQESVVHRENNVDCERALREVVCNHRLSFSPNLESGTCALKSTHGLIKILCCGTLHQDSSFVGIFEQEFGLVMNPSDKLWKIFYTKVNLKQAVTDLPQLPSCEIFEIES